MAVARIRDYEVIKSIGEGSFGKALLVRNKTGDKMVVKEIKMSKVCLLLNLFLNLVEY